MNYDRIYNRDLVNGEGVRTTLFVMGCNHACEGCYNKSTWNPRDGHPFTQGTADMILKELEPNFVAGLTLTGGDPLFRDNVPTILNLIKQVRARYGDEKNIWCWTGYTLDEIHAQDGKLGEMRREIVSLIDVLIDGKFEKDKHSPDLEWRGSSNQIIHRFKL